MAGTGVPAPAAPVTGSVPGRFPPILSFLWIEPPGAGRRNGLQAVRRVMYGCRLRLRHARATVPTYPVQNVDKDGNERWNHRLYGYGFRYPRFDVRSRPYRPTLTNHHHKCYRKTLMRCDGL